MATGKSGYFDITGTYDMIVRVRWSETYDIATNTSIVTVSPYLIAKSYGNTFWLTGTISVGGTAIGTMNSEQGTHYVNIWSADYNQEKPFLASGGAQATWSASVAHDADGGKDVTIAVTVSGTGDVFWTASGSKTVALYDIPRASAVSLSHTSLNMGNILTISIDRHASAFTHTLKYKIGSTEGTIATSVGTSYKWTIPLSLAALIPTDTSGKVTITCITYNGSTQVGSATAAFTAKVPNNTTTQPNFTEDGLTLAPVGDLDTAFAGIYIRGKTGMKVTIEASSDYSTIESYSVAFNGASYTGSQVQIPTITISGELSVAATVTDARGYSTTVTKKITVIPYDNPRVIPYTGENEVIAIRCQADGTPDDGGTCLLLKVGMKYSPVVSDGTQKNFCDLKYCYKASTSEEFGAWATLIAKNDTSVTEQSVVVAGIFPSATTSYNVKIAVSDDLDGYHGMDFIITTDDVTLHLREGGKGAAFGKYSEEDELLELNPEWGFGLRGYKMQDFVVEQGISGVWTYRKWCSGLAECWATSSSIPSTFPITFTNTPKRFSASAYSGSGYDVYVVGNWK